MSNINLICEDCGIAKRDAFQESGVPKIYKGDYVKANFGREWMWVKVTEVIRNTLKGKLANDPVLPETIEAGYFEGKLVEIKKKEICEHIRGEKDD